MQTIATSHLTLAAYSADRLFSEPAAGIQPFRENHSLCPHPGHWVCAVDLPARVTPGVGGLTP
jgi:hypothetical protein